jgi:hypothetical protein
MNTLPEACTCRARLIEKAHTSRILLCGSGRVHGSLLISVAGCYTTAWPLPLQAPPTSGGDLHDSVVCRLLHLLGAHTGNDPLHVMSSMEN